MEIKFSLAKLSDLNDLVKLEQESFQTDILSRGSFRHFLASDKSDLIVAKTALKNTQKVLGYALLLYNRGTSLARLYSIAVSPNARGMGLGQRLLIKAEEYALNRNKTHLRLEVRPDNKAGISLYKKNGYREFGIKPQFYEDKTDALRFEKRLLPAHLGFKMKVPYYKQNMDFTCGPACLLMAMAASSKKIKPSFEEELNIWREATTIFMTSGHGGCGPKGLALAAYKRGFKSEIWVSNNGPMFLDSVRSVQKKEVIKLVHQNFDREIRRHKIPQHIGRLTQSDLERIFKKQGIPLILISSYKITKSKAPHWVVLAGYDEKHFYIHDPEWEQGEAYDPMSKSFPEVAYIPVLKKEFFKMAKYGSKKDQACVIIYP